MLLFVFFLFEPAPIHFNRANVELLERSELAGELAAAKTRYEAIHGERAEAVVGLADVLRDPDAAGPAPFDSRSGGPDAPFRSDAPGNVGPDGGFASGAAVAALTPEAALARVRQLDKAEAAVRLEVDDYIRRLDPDLETKDEDYIFISYVLDYLPIGVVGLLIAVIFSAAMSSSASELNALATTTVVDLYRRRFKTDGDDRHYLLASKAFTVAWGLVALAFAAGASLFDNLIEAVNIIGSLFYGSILGIFVVAFFVKWVGGRAVFYGALVAEAVVVPVYFANYYDYIDFTYLWLNPLGCVVCVAAAMLFELTIGESGGTAGSVGGAGRAAA